MSIKRPMHFQSNIIHNSCLTQVTSITSTTRNLKFISTYSKMCQQIEQLAANTNSSNNNKMKATYSIKKVLKTLFKKQQSNKQQAQQSTFEDLENLRNLKQEEQFYTEIDENAANEKLSDICFDDVYEEDIYVPVRFVRTEAGTFFWTTNLQPVTSTIIPLVDEDLVQPAYCYSNNQYPYMQFQDRWAQA